MKLEQIKALVESAKAKKAVAEEVTNAEQTVANIEAKVVTDAKPADGVAHAEENKAGDAGKVAKEVEEGRVYTGKVVKVEDFGCFVELWPGCEGLVHVSQLDTKRVEKPSDLVKVGDEIIVKSLGHDNI